jgi:hypothetical protein
MSMAAITMNVADPITTHTTTTVDMRRGYSEGSS